MKNTTAIIGIVVIIVAASVFIFTNSGGAMISVSNISDGKNIQIVKLSVENGKYVMSPSTVKKDILVRIEADMLKMPRCSKSIVISAFNVRKTFSETDNSVEFIPDKVGNFNIVCSMNMYRGTFTVLDDDGIKPVYVEQSSESQGSCEVATGGVCSCGG